MDGVSLVVMEETLRAEGIVCKARGDRKPMLSGNFRQPWMCGAEGMAGDADEEGGRSQMTGVSNPSQEFGFYWKGNRKPLKGSKQGCGMVKQVL